MIPTNTLIHLVHSSFLLKINQCVLIFDYPISESEILNKELGIKEGFLNPHELKDEKVFFFHSHHHSDHFHSDIFNFPISQKHFILSSEIKTFPQGSLIVDPLKEYKLDHIAIQTHASTDCGVAFSIQCEGKNIYFSGDNAFWNWDELKEERDFFLKTTSSIAKAPPIDIAFQVCDPRLEGKGEGGIYLFAEMFNPKLLVPIHSFNDYSINKKVEKQLLQNQFTGQFWCVQKRGDSLKFPV